MAERAGIQLDVVGYALGQLAGAEHARFEQHLTECAACRVELAELEGAARMLSLAAPADRPPASLAARTLLAVEREATRPRPPPAFARPRRRRVFALAPGVAVGVAVVVALLARDPRTLELDATLRSPSQPGVTGTVRVTETGIGRVVGGREHGPAGARQRARVLRAVVRRPWRCAGLTRPRLRENVPSGRVRAAPPSGSPPPSVPADYPAVIVTREPRDGDPRPGGPVVLRGP